MRTDQNTIGFSARMGVYLLTCFLMVNASALAQGGMIEIDYHFHHGSLGWTEGFADYPEGEEQFYELASEIRYMPRKLTRVPRRGLYIQGNNHSDDLFMFLKRRLDTTDGIAPNQTYRVEFVLTFASNAPSNCSGTGGAPGEGVVLKAGASGVEPLAVLQPSGYYRMNVDIGDHEVGGPAASVAGNIANGIPCEQALPIFPFALVQRVHQHRFDVVANSTGELWLLIGTDSGFESLTRIFYQSINVRVIPVL